MAANSNRQKGRRVARTAVRAILILWAGFWAFFAIAHLFVEYIAGNLPYVAMFLAPLIALVVSVWRWPRIGGPALMVAGIASAFFFHDVFAQATLALPAVMLGLLLALLGR